MFLKFFPPRGAFQKKNKLRKPTRQSKNPRHLRVNATQAMELLNQPVHLQRISFFVFGCVVCPYVVFLLMFYFSFQDIIKRSIYQNMCTSYSKSSLFTPCSMDSVPPPPPHPPLPSPALPSKEKEGLAHSPLWGEGWVGGEVGTQFIQ